MKSDFREGNRGTRFKSGRTMKGQRQCRETKVIIEKETLIDRNSGSITTMVVRA